MSARLAGRAARLTAVLAITAVAGLGPGSAFATDSGSSGVSTVNTETVQTYLNADGKIDSSRIYEQLTLTGDGSLTVKNPVDTNGLRNLNGFGGLDTKDGAIEKHYDVNGVAQDRSVSTFDSSKLPLSVDVQYVLDGQKVSAGDLVGATGDVKVTYTVKNLTTKQMPLTFTDGAGGTKTETGYVPIPIVGTVVFDLPKNFTNVQSVAASMGGDGHGGTQMEYLLTLFPPIGSDTVSFDYTAHLTDGMVPPVSFTAVPVDPLTNPTFTTAADSYQAGADTGDKLAEGATKINTNLLRLRDGAGQLLDGLARGRAAGRRRQSGRPRGSEAHRRTDEAAHRLVGPAEHPCAQQEVPAAAGRPHPDRTGSRERQRPADQEDRARGFERHPARPPGGSEQRLPRGHPRRSRTQELWRYRCCGCAREIGGAQSFTRR